MDYEDDEKFSYREDVAINPNELDVEWLEQPMLFANYAKLSAVANRKAKRADEKVKSIRSELVLKCNKFPDTCLGKGIKATGANVEAYYRINEGYRLAKEELHDLEFEADVYENAVSAIRQRKASLDNLVQLLLGQYFSGPASPRDIKSIWRDRSTIKENAVSKIKNAR